MAEVAAGSSAFVSPPAGRGEETMARLVIRGSGGGVNRWSGLAPDQLLRRACRRNALARAMRRVQLQGGARGPHARRTLCTLSVRPRAPTPQTFGRGASPPFRYLPPGFVAPAKPALESGTLPRGRQVTDQRSHRRAIGAPVRARASPAQPIPGGGFGGGRRGPLRQNAADGPL